MNEPVNSSLNKGYLSKKKVTILNTWLIDYKKICKRVSFVLLGTMMRFSVYVLSAFCLLFVSCGKKKEVKKPPPKVYAAHAAKKTVPYYLEGIGHVRAYNSANIQSQVEGYLEGIHYTQGKDVNKGDILITIDPDNYKAKLEESEGELEQSKAQLRFAEEKVIRFTKLVEDDYVSKLNYDEYVSNFQALLGTVKRNQGSVDNARTNLDYCYIKAPFTGRVGKKLVDIGNLVQNDGSTLLIVNQIQPIYVDFSLPEKQLTRILKKQSKENLEVKVHIPEVEVVEEIGKLIVVSNSVDETTGMVPLRAEFKNEDELLWPGQFAKVRLILRDVEDAILVPEEAINLGQKGMYVEVIEADNIAKFKYVEVGETYGDLVVIEKGIEEGELVITTGQIQVKPNSPVNVVKVEDDILKKFKEW